MNRNDEFRALLAELESPPAALETTVERALNREKAKKKTPRFRRSRRKSCRLFPGICSAGQCFPALCQSLRGDPHSAGACKGSDLVALSYSGRGE